MKVTLNNYAGSCLQESKLVENLTVTNTTNSSGVFKPIAEIIEESTCPDNCSDNCISIAGMAINLDIVTHMGWSFRVILFILPTLD